MQAIGYSIDIILTYQHCYRGLKLLYCIHVIHIHVIICQLTLYMVNAYKTRTHPLALERDNSSLYLYHFDPKSLYKTYIPMIKKPTSGSFSFWKLDFYFKLWLTILRENHAELFIFFLRNNVLYLKPSFCTKTYWAPFRREKNIFFGN